MSLAVHDSAPLKLHCIRTLRRVGEVSERDWLLELAAFDRMIALLPEPGHGV